ncbi:MAG TPA: hypothetical protein VMY77_10530 [Chitinophagaceae bacterium]|nr:hypothetical protein [Chitinophagaceae bacterium]
MKVNFLLLTIITAAISSCSTSYKTGQTPDDVYYSPARLQTDEVRRDREENNSVDNTVYTTSEDREIRRRVHNRRNRRYNDMYDRYDRYDYPYGYNNGYPVYGKPTNGTPQNTQQPRKTNLGAYTPNSGTPDSSNYNPKTGKINTGTTSAPVRTFGTPGNSSNNTGSGVGNFIRKVFTPDNNNYNSGRSDNSTPSRTFDNSSSSSSRTFDTKSSSNSSSGNSNSSTSTPSSSSTSAPVRTFKKDN